MTKQGEIKAPRLRFQACEVVPPGYTKKGTCNLPQFTDNSARLMHR